MSCKLLVVGVTLLCATSIAQANHTKYQRIVDDSPFTLEPGETKIGLASVEIGLGGHPLLRLIDVGTNPWLWASNALGTRSYNGRAKYEFYRDERFSLSARVAFYQIGSGQARARLVPIEFYAGVRINPDWTIGLGYKHVNLNVRGGVELSEDVELLGNVGLTTAQLRSMAEYRLSERTAFVFRGQLFRYQELRAEASADIDPIDAEAGVFVDKNLLPAETAFTLALVTAWSWRRLNLELGIQYGNVEIPGVAAVAAKRLILPVGDIYWRF